MGQLAIAGNVLNIVSDSSLAQDTVKSRKGGAEEHSSRPKKREMVSKELRRNAG